MDNLDLRIRAARHGIDPDNYLLRDDGDGPYIAAWNDSTDRPTEQELLDADWQSARPPDPSEELAKAIEAATTLGELKSALLGSLTPGQKGRASGRPT